MRRSRPHVSGAVLAAVLLLALCEAPPHAREPARWVELRTPYFTVVSNGREDDARRLAGELERVRTWLQRARTNARFDSRDPVVVLAVGSENGLRELLPQFWERKGQRPVAAYWRGPYRQCIALRTDASEHERYRRILHEYVHLLTHATFPDLPVWLDEGVSEFWATAIPYDDAVEVGRPSPENLRALRTRPWIPLDQLLAMERLPDAGDKDKLSLFYAQSWALVHYLMLGGPSVNLDLAPAAHLAASSQLESAVAAYVSGGRFRAIRLEIPASAISEDQNESLGIPLRTLTPAASLAVRAGCLAEGERPLAALPLLAKAIAENSADASVHETLGYVHFQQNEPAEAAGWFDRAIESGSAGHLAYFYRAILATSVPNRAQDGQPVHVDEYLRKSIDLSKSFAPAYSRLAAVYASEEGRSDDALTLLVRTTELEPEDPAYWVDLGRFLSGRNRTVEARQAGEKGLAVARSVSARRLVEKFLNEIPR